MAERWRNMTKEEQSPYIVRHEEEKKRYEVEKKAQLQLITA